MSVNADRVVQPPVRPDLAEPVVATDAVGGARAAHDERWARWLAWACTAAAIVPVVVAAARAIAQDWLPLGDNAYFALRAGDVLTEHHPLLGTWTSASLTAGIDMNNPGPLYFDALALPVRVGGDAGLVVGVALVNILAIAGTAIVAHRVAGPRAVVVAMAGAAGLGWAMGSELLFSPWQPHALLLPALCVLVMVWALACGDLAVLPWAVVVASLMLQTHIGYAVVVPALLACGLGAGVYRSLQSRGPDHDPGAVRRRLARTAAIAAAVGVVCWAQPLYEQLFGDGRGNLGRLLSSVGGTGESVGLADAPRYVASVLALAPWWARPSLAETLVSEGPRASLAASVVSLAVVVALLVAGLVLAHRSRADAAAAASATGLVAVGVAIVAVAIVPIELFGFAPSHQVLWLWPLAVFVTMAVLVPLVSGPGPRRGVLVGVISVAAVVLGAWNVPAMNARLGPAADAASMPAVRELVSELAPLQGERGVLVDLRGQRFAEPYSAPVMLELERLGVPWFVDEPGQLRQVGDRAHEGEASVRLFIREYDEARRTPRGAERIAYAEGPGDSAVAVFTEPLADRP